MKFFLFTILFCSAAAFCSCQSGTTPSGESKTAPHEAPVVKRPNSSGVRTIHVFVALCDNKYQGIVPVGKVIGNGQDADNNLYWGCNYGVRAHFSKKNSEWTLIKTRKQVSDTILERILFKHKTENVYLLADAYDGRFIRETTIDFLNASSANAYQSEIYKNDTLWFGGASNLVSYIGHDGLMDFSLPGWPLYTDTTKREAIILACYSKNYFGHHLRSTGAIPLLWTTGLMAPEAYTLHDALGEWVKGEGVEKVRQAAAEAYARYQHCSVKAAKNLLVSGW